MAQFVSCPKCGGMADVFDWGVRCRQCGEQTLRGERRSAPSPPPPPVVHRPPPKQQPMPTATRLPTDAGTIGKRTVLTESQQVITRAAIQVGELLEFIAALPDRPVVRRFPDRIEDTRQLGAYRDAIMAMNRKLLLFPKMNCSSCKLRESRADGCAWSLALLCRMLRVTF
jgi:hypothetical protein